MPLPHIGPALVVFSTPVYCVSQFCGPVTDLVEELAADYADRADFIHVEIYRDFEAQELNPAVIDWLVGPDGNFREPWTFLIGADGTIIGSWDTVVTRGEIEPLLEALPAILAFGVDEVVLHRVAGQGHAAVDAELGAHVGQVAPHGVGADAQRLARPRRRSARPSSGAAPPPRAG